MCRLPALRGSEGQAATTGVVAGVPPWKPSSTSPGPQQLLRSAWGPAHRTARANVLQTQGRAAGCPQPRCSGTPCRPSSFLRSGRGRRRVAGWHWAGRAAPPLPAVAEPRRFRRGSAPAAEPCSVATRTAGSEPHALGSGSGFSLPGPEEACLTDRKPGSRCRRELLKSPPALTVLSQRESPREFSPELLSLLSPCSSSCYCQRPGA